MNTTMPHLSSPQAHTDLFQPHWNLGGNIWEKQPPGAIGQAQQADPQYPIFKSVPSVDNLRSSSASASACFGTDGLDGQPLYQCTPSSIKRDIFDGSPTVSGSHSLAPASQSWRIQSQSNPQTINMFHSPLPSDGKVPPDPTQNASLSQNYLNLFGATIPQTQVPCPKPSTTVSAPDCLNKFPDRKLTVPTASSRRTRRHSNLTDSSSPQETTVQPRNQSIMDSIMPLESLVSCPPPSKAAFEFRSPAPNFQVTYSIRQTKNSNSIRLSLPTLIPGVKDIQIPVSNEKPKSRAGASIPKSEENRRTSIKVPNRHMSKDDTFLDQIASSVAAAAPPLFQVGKGPKESAPSGGASKLCPSTIDALIRDTILNRVNKEGHVYILKSPKYFEEHFPNEPPLLKIGMATDVSKRMENLRTKCGLFDLDRVPDWQDRPCKFYWKVEELVHTELRNFRRLLKCKKCKNATGSDTEHQEWFAVDEEVAVKTVQRWRRFIEMEPYDENGVLKHHWSRMIEPRNMEHPNAEEKWSDSYSRDLRWKKWLDGVTMGEKA